MQLLSDIHYLAAVLDPKLFDAEAGDVAEHVENAFGAINVLCSIEVFTPEQSAHLDEHQRIVLLRQQFSNYVALSETFMAGTYAVRAPGAAVEVAKVMAFQWDLWRWWSRLRIAAEDTPRAQNTTPPPMRRQCSPRGWGGPPSGAS